VLIALLEEYLELGGVGSLHLHFSLSARKKLPQYYDRTKAWDHNICQSFMLKVHGGHLLSGEFRVWECLSEFRHSLKLS